MLSEYLWIRYKKNATHGTNLPKYKVFSIMTHDAFDNEQFVQHAIMRNERTSTLLTALEEFEGDNRVKRILINKGIMELGVLKTAFPEALVLLCQFHVIEHLREQIGLSDYGGRVPWQKQQLYGMANLLVYVKTEHSFLKSRNYMRHILAVGSDTFRHQAPLQLGSGQDDLGPVGNDVGRDDTELGPVGTRLACDDTCKYKFKSRCQGWF
ncbi:hypothetical protein L917_17496 [Phytophthora nicotianae]|uniref:ZSWIM1/3 RNaseH-like domain-containing protein n=1 Tax=Phytophthora nicotianae TaxID=4792 RepID=W2KB47_PHYNI|nr:hypothetical protein L917_17496 [Phytophthora nicotianae]